MNALRIAHLTATFPPYAGGAGNTAFRFAKEQAARGHHVEVFTAPADGDPPDPGGAVVHRIKPLYQYGNAPLIPRLATIDGFDVIHLHYPFIFGAELVLAGRLRRTRRSAALLVHYKNQLVGGDGPRRPLFAAYERTVAPVLIRQADRICILSEGHARSVPYLRRALERTPERLVEMPNGVDAELFSPASNAQLRVKLGIPEDAVVAAFVATLDRAHYFKRLDVAIEALARTGGSAPSSPRQAGESQGSEARREPPELHLVVAGGGEMQESFRRQAVALQVADRVHFLGSVPHAELPGVLNAADLLLLTTEPPESFGIVLIEAMAAGLPAVATDYPGVRAVIDPGQNGLVVPPGDPAAVAEALDSVVGLGAERRTALGEAGRDKAERVWAWPRLVDRMDETYEGAVDARRAKVGRR